MSNTTTIPNHDLVIIRIGVDAYLYERTPEERDARMKGLTKDRAKAARLPRWQAFDVAAHYAIPCDCGSADCGYPVAEQIDIEPAEIH